MKRRIGLLLAAALLLAALLAGCGTPLQKASKNLTSYEIVASLDLEDMTVTATQKVDYVNSASVPLDSVVFNLYPNGYREDATYRPVTAEQVPHAYPNGMSYGDISVSRVEAGGRPALFTVGGTDRNELAVPLEKELYPDERVTIEIDFITSLANINHRLGYGKNTVNLGNWYPVACIYEDGQFQSYPYYANGDPFYSECANYTVTMTVPDGCVLASTGTKESEKRTNDGIVATHTAKAVRDFAMVVSDKFQVVDGTVDGVAVKYYYFRDPNYAASLDIALNSVKTFNRIFGAYPYATLSVVEADFVHGGMEYPNLIYISTELDADTYSEVIVHETAHQWWYGAVGSNEVRHAWMDEGLAEFSTALFYHENAGYRKTLEQITATSNLSYKNYLRLLLSMNLKPDTSMNRAANEFKTEYEYVTMTYAKGELLFDELMRILGEQKFYAGLKKYYGDYCFRNATPEDLIGSFEKAANRSLAAWFDSWLTGKVIL